MFLRCLIEAEKLAEEYGSSYNDKLILEMYRNYSFESDVDLLVNRVMASEYDIIRGHYWRYLGPVIQCEKTSSHLVSLLLNNDFFQYTSSISNALITKDLSLHEGEILQAMTFFAGKEKHSDSFMSLCKLIRRETEISFRDLLLDNFSHMDLDLFSNVDFCEALGFQLNIEDLEILPELFNEELNNGARWKKPTDLNITKTACILVERHLDNNSLERIHHWLKNKDLEKICLSIFMKVGNYDSIHFIEQFDNQEMRGSLYETKITISLMSQRKEIVARNKMKIESFKNFEKILLRGGISGVSTTKFFDYYTGIDKRKILTATERRDILSQIYLTDLVFSSNDIPIRTPYLRGTSFDKRQSHLVGLLGNLETRKTFAANNIRKRPWHPQGLYTYGILTEDAKWLADTYGKELGIYVCKIPTNVPGIYGFKVYNLNSSCNSCDESQPLHINEVLRCFACGGNLCEQEENVVIDGAVQSKFTTSEIGSEKYSYGEIDLSQKDIEAIKSAFPIIIESELPQFSNHLAAIYADIEEMMGIPGDSRKRLGLE